MLKKNRCIHLKSVFARTVDAVVVKEMKSPLDTISFSPTRPSGPSWSSSPDVRVFVSLFVPFPCHFFAWSDWCRACLVRGLVQSQSRVEP